MPLSILLYYYISFGVNILAALFMLVLLFLPKDKWIKDEAEKKLFQALIISTLLGAALGTVSYSSLALRKVLGGASWFRTARDVCTICMVIALYHFVFQWLVYVDYRLYKSRDQLFRRYRILYVPVLIFLVGRVLAEIAGSFFSLPLDEIFQMDLLLYIDDIFGFLFILLSAVLVFQYKNQKERGSLFSILPGVVPILIGYIVNWFTGYSTIAIGDAFGVVFLYIAMLIQKHYYDSFGFYSIDYLLKLQKNGDPGLEKLRGAVVFETSGELDALGRILRKELAVDDLIIRDGSNGFVLLSRSGKPEELKFLANMVEGAAEEEENGSPVTTKCLARKKGEDVKLFLDRTVRKM